MTAGKHRIGCDGTCSNMSWTCYRCGHDCSPCFGGFTDEGEYTSEGEVIVEGGDVCVSCMILDAVGPSTRADGDQTLAKTEFIYADTEREAMWQASRLNVDYVAVSARLVDEFALGATVFAVTVLHEAVHTVWSRHGADRCHRSGKKHGSYTPRGSSQRCSDCGSKFDPAVEWKEE